MLPYWLLFGCFAGGALFYGQPRPNRSSLVLIFAAVAVTAMIGLRFRVGGDWANYREIFGFITQMDFWEAIRLTNSDPAYSLLNWLAVQLGVGIWFVNLICGGVLMWGVTKIALRQPNPWLVFVIAIPYLIIVVGMGYTRQAAAIGVSLVAITALLDGKLRKFLLLMVLATLFHKTAVILLPIMGLAYSRNRFVTGALLAAAALLLYYFVVSARIGALTAGYVAAQMQSEGATVRVAMNAVPAAIFLISQRRFGFDEHERTLWRNLSLAALVAVIALVFQPSSTAVDRIALYFTGVQLVMLGRMPWAWGGRGIGRSALVFVIIAYSAAIQFVWLNYATHARLWLPYRVYPFL